MTTGQFATPQTIASTDLDVKPDITVREEKVELGAQTQKVLSGDVPPVGIAAVLKDEEPVLSPQQQTILEKIMNGENYFFTGSAGTGKSVLLRAIIKAFKDRRATEIAESHANMERKWQDYLTLGLTGTASSPGAKRWNLGVTASTGMAGV